MQNPNMNNFNKNLNKNIKPLLFVLVLLAGITFATAQSIWTDPTKSPAGDNVPPPITAGTEFQEKQGGVISTGILNNLGAFVTFSDLDVGYRFGSGHDKTPAYMFGDTYFKTVTTGFGIPAENQLCVDGAGKVKICDSTINNGTVMFKPVKDVLTTNFIGSSAWQTSFNVVFPSGGVAGAVKFDIGSGMTCTSVNAPSTSWTGGNTISGVNNNYAVTFYDWGTYDLKIQCGTPATTYTATINVTGKIATHLNSKEITYNLSLGKNRTAVVMATSGGGSGVSSNKMSVGANGSGCPVVYDGDKSYVNLGGSDIVYLSGGGGGQGGRWRNKTATSGGACPGIPGAPGKVTTNKLTNSTANSGYYGASNDTVNGITNKSTGCSGAPDANGNLNKCRDIRGTTPNDGHGGVGIAYSQPTCTLKQMATGDCHGWTSGGGGGAYAKGNYTLPTTGTLKLYAGSSNGAPTSFPVGKNGYIEITW